MISEGKKMEIIEDVKINTKKSTGRLSVMIYAIAAYNIGAGALFWLIFAAGGFAPIGFVNLSGDNVFLALIINALLVVAFGVQHSVMARARFKQSVARIIPQQVERSTFVLASGVMAMFAILLWQPVETVVWQVENGVVSLGLQIAYVFGIVYLLASSFVTNHFELFGLLIVIDIPAIFSFPTI